MNKPSQALQNPLTQVFRTGQSIWYDGLIAPEEFDRMIREDGIRGATTNPAIFEKALSEGVHTAASGGDAESAYRDIAVKAVQEVCDLFTPMYRESSGGDGYVSIEVSPHLAYDTAGTVAEAKELWKLVARPNVMIKIPATREGLPAVTAAIAEGINVNVTLIFSVERHREVMDAYLSGLERRSAKNAPVDGIASVASFFVSRVDSSIDKLLEEKAKADPAKKAEAEALFGRAGIANSKAAYAAFLEVFSSPRYEALKKKGARLQRPLWASTGTKNPRYRDVLYVEELMGADTVNTVPPATLAAFRDHGTAAPRLKEGWREARETFAKLHQAGISIPNVTAELESAGVKLFCEAYDKIIAGLKEKRR